MITACPRCRRLRQVRTWPWPCPCGALNDADGTSTRRPPDRHTGIDTTCGICGFQRRLRPEHFPAICRCRAILDLAAGTITTQPPPTANPRRRRYRVGAHVDRLMADHCDQCDALPCLAKKTCQHADAITLGARCPRGHF